MYQTKNKVFTEANSETFLHRTKEADEEKFIVPLCLECIWFVLILHFMDI